MRVRLPSRSLSLLAAAGALACAPETPPNLLLISIDSLRFDHLGCYGYSRPTSPNLDRLASDAILFERAYSTASWTLPSHLSLLSSLYPQTHGAVGSTSRLHENALLLPELLGGARYRSGAVVSGPYLDRRFGYDQGWEQYDDSILDLDGSRSNHAASHRAQTSKQVHGRALELLDRFARTKGPAPAPFFLFLHYWDVHYDYAPPPPYDRRFDPDYTGSVTGANYARDPAVHPGMAARDLEHIEALYDGEIAWVDSWLGKLVDELERRGLLERTVVVVTADHGEEFFEHGKKGHRQNLYDPSLRVPLLVRLPGARGGGLRVATPVSLVDVAPTLSTLAGVRLPEVFEGRSLLAPGRSPMPRLEPVDLFADLKGRNGVLVRGDWKLHLKGGYRKPPHQLELYDLGNDARETIDLAPNESHRANSLYRVLFRMQRRSRVLGRALWAPPVRLPEPALEELRALGYL